MGVIDKAFFSRQGEVNGGEEGHFIMRINHVRWPSVLDLNDASSTASLKICGNSEVANFIAVSQKLNLEY